MKLKHGLLWLVLFVAGASVSFGQMGKAASEQRLSDAAAGYSFVAPAGWKSSQNAEGFGLLNAAETVIVSVRPHGYSDFDAVLRDSKFDEGYRVAGQPQDLKAGGKALRVTKMTQNGLAVIDFFVRFSPNGGGVVVMAISESSNSDAAFNAGLKVIDSVAFTKPQAASAGSGSPWQAALSGKHLLYLYSGNGYFEEKHIYLCTTGVFYQKTGSGGFTPNDADGGSFGAKGGKRGQWSVSGTTLVLRFQDGTVGEYRLTQRQASNEVGLNGNKYFVQANAGC